MDFSALEQSNLQLRRNNDFERAYFELHQLLQVLNPENRVLDRARVNFLLALTYYNDGPRNLPPALSVSEEIIPILADDPETQCRALFNGLVFAGVACDLHRLRDWSLRLRALLAKHPTMLHKWYGRSATALSRSAVQLGNRERALAYAREAIEFYKSGGCPHNERDTQTWLGLSYGHMAELIVEEDPNQAERLIRLGFSAMPAGARDEMLHYVLALVFHNTSRHDMVADHLTRVQMKAEEHRDHRLRFRVARLWVLHTQVSGDPHRALMALNPLIREVAHGRMIDMLQELQTLRTKLMGVSHTEVRQ